MINKEHLIFTDTCLIPKKIVNFITNSHVNCLNSNKINNFLNKEIKKYILKYVYHINSLSVKILFINDVELITNVKISKINYENVSDIFNTQRMIMSMNSKSKSIEAKKIYYLLFLQDSNVEICFWKNYIIKPKAGTIIIYPASWCFPFTIDINNNETYILHGYVYDVVNIEVGMILNQ